MSYINLNNKYNSDSLLFSIPVHEKYDIINNQVENILNNNPNSKIIIHANKSFSDFNENYINYKNVYINPNRIEYKYGCGLLKIHTDNFYEAIKMNINFDYFILLSSNEMFIKKGCIDYIKKNKNGIQLIEYDESIIWHNFGKRYQDLINDENVVNLLNYLNLKKLIGGQSEGQFFEKLVYENIANIFLKFFKNADTNFETEELIIQTIFFSLNQIYGDPITLQNYSNKLSYDTYFIKRLLNNTIIPNNIVEGNLISPHVNKNSNNIYSIKRVDRTFNKIRKFLSNKGFILNKDTFQVNTHYYSYNSSLTVVNEKNIIFEKKNENAQEFQWFGFNLNKNTYILKFKFTINEFVNEFSEVGIKIHKPIEYIISNIFHNVKIGESKDVTLSIIIENKQDLLFIFDNISKKLKFNLTDFSINDFNVNLYKKKKKMVLFFHDNYKEFNNELFNYFNIINELINPLNHLYDILIFISLKKNNPNITNIIKNLNPHKIIYNDYNSINDILLELLMTANKFLENSNINLCMMFPINILLKKNIKYIPFFINKINFLSYTKSYYDGLDYNDDVFIFDYKYSNFIINLLKKYLNINTLLNNFNKYIKNEIDSNNIHVIINENINSYDENKYFKYNNQIYLLNNVKSNEGFLFSNYYDKFIIRSNLYSYFYRFDKNIYYYYKKKYNSTSLYNWCGVYFQTTNKDRKNININISFQIKLNTKVDHDQVIGIKTHFPEIIHKDWLKECKLYEYKSININTTIEHKNQEIILYFDEYHEQIEFYIKDFKVDYKL